MAGIHSIGLFSFNTESSGHFFWVFLLWQEAQEMPLGWDVSLCKSRHPCHSLSSSAQHTIPREFC